MSYASGINNLQLTVGSVESANPAEPTSIQPGGSSTQVSHADQADLSSAAGSIAQSLTTSDVRTDKVAALQQAIASGSYNVSSGEVADTIIQSLLR